jgi:hypothetical protein
VDDRRLKSQGPKGLTHLKRDEAGTDDQCPFHSALLNEPFDRDSIAEIAKTEYSVKILPGNIWKAGGDSGGNHEAVKAEFLAVRKVEFVSVDVDTLNRRVEFNLDPGFSKCLRCPGEQLGMIPNYITDVIGRRSGCKGYVFAGLKNGDVQARINPLGLRSGTWSGRTPSDNEEPFFHETSLLSFSENLGLRIVVSLTVLY